MLILVVVVMLCFILVRLIGMVLRLVISCVVLNWFLSWVIVCLCRLLRIWLDIRVFVLLVRFCFLVVILCMCWVV